MNLVRQKIGLGLGLGLGVGALVWLLRIIAALPVEAPTPPPTPASAPQPIAAPAPPPSLIVARVQGVVERQTEGAAWQPLTADARITQSERVRTHEDGSAVLVAGDGVQLTLAAQSQVTVERADAEAPRLTVDKGRLSARVTGSAAQLSVRVDGSDTRVRTTHGEFSLLRDERAQVAVAVTAGDVALSAHAASVQLAAGEQSIVQTDRPPAAPMRIPTSLFLKVSRGYARQSNQRSAELGGETNPGAVVYVNGVAAETDATGRFTARVPLQEGKNKLKVVAVDVLGRSQQQELPAVEVDTKPPSLRGKAIW